MTPYSAREPLDGRIPITSSKVSYGFPTGDISSSPGLKFDIKASASSPLKQEAYTFSSVSLPRSLYPYPELILKHSALTRFSCIAFMTFIWLYSALASISAKRSFKDSSIFSPNSYTSLEIPRFLYCSSKNWFIAIYLSSLRYWAKLFFCCYKLLKIIIVNLW